MLNYIWGGLIACSLFFALMYDFRDAANDTYRNDQELPITLQYTEGYQPGARRVEVDILIDPATYNRHFGNDVSVDSSYSGYVIRMQQGNQLRFSEGSALPEPLSTILEFSSSRDNELQGVLQEESPTTDESTFTTGVAFAEVRFVKLRAIAQAAFDFAEVGATLALGLIGVLALFLGLLKIAEAGGLIKTLVKFTQPLFRPLFPEIPDGHPALGMIVLNLTANMLGLGNAATPLGIKAMEELQKLNPTDDTATNSMVMLLALNTASVQLVPPTLLVALIGLQVNELIFPIIAVTLFSAIVAVTATRLLQKLPGYRATDPNRSVESASE